MLNYIKILYINNFLLYEEEKEDFFMNYLHCLKEKMLDLMSNLGYTDNTMKQHLLIIDRYINYLNTNSLSACKSSADQFFSNEVEISSRIRNQK